LTTEQDVLAAGGRCGALVRELDWSATPLGPAERWPSSLRFNVQTVLSSRYPMLLLWGHELTQIYNDAYAQLIGDKHPAAMGIDVRVTLAEGWDVLGPLIADAMDTGIATWVPALLLLLERSGYREEAYFTVSHAPARDDDGATVGMLTVCSEVTEQVVSERRLRLLRDLSLSGTQTLRLETCIAQLQEVLAERRLDLPFAAVYLRSGGVLSRALAVGADLDGAPVGSQLPDLVTTGVDDAWGLLEASSGALARRDVPSGTRVAGGPWGDLVRTSLALPLPSADPEQPLGVLLVGLTPNRPLDEGGTTFVEVAAQQVGAALRKATAYEDERRRAEALAELDRAKTHFFTNVSHEFRTPLTLLLGPLEDALADEQAPLPEPQHDRLVTARRNAERLLRLVNDLLSFTSLEAGATSPEVAALDLAAVTVEHASAFRAAVERAGLRLEVDCPPLPRPVRMDPGHWETIVTNLLSNALKHTFVGSVRVSLRADDAALVLTVADTGIGIAEDARAGLFERFARVQGAQSRSHEGSGIGLALVAELMRVNGGEVTVESEVGVGTAFRLAFPWAAVAATPDAVTTAPAGGSRARAAADEALQWFDDPADVGAPAPPPGRRDTELSGARVLVADDNGDMRGYLTRLLTEAGCHVLAVADGAAALQAVREHRPDLLLTDVMMPVLDGFELLQQVRREPSTRTLPVVVLSARAGSEAGVEGLDLGADDYLVKPFRADELLARLRSTLRLARLRSGHAAQLAAVADTAAVLSGGSRLPDAVRDVAEQARALVGATALRVLLHPRDARPAVGVVTPGPDVPGAQPADLVLPVRGSTGELGQLEVWSPADPLARELLLPVGVVLTALAEGAGRAERDSDVVATLQRSLLPERLPEVPGLELAASYLPAATGLQVGGDWYDVLPLHDGRVAVSVGDAAGSGLSAATAMGQLRGALRAYVLQGADPAGVLGDLDALTDRLGTTSFATVWLGYLDPATGELSWCSAGHPSPLLLEPGAPARWLPADPAPPVGAGSRTGHRTSTLHLPPGSALVLFTDGLVEDRATQLDAGPAQLLARLDRSEAGAEGLVEAALSDRADRLEDDVAVLALRRVPVAAELAVVELDETRTYAAVPRTAGVVRRDLRRSLSEAGVPEEHVFPLLLAVSEAVSNAVEHAQAPSRPELQVRLVLGSTACRVSVQDFGTWRERPPALDRGRGAALMAAAGDVRVVPSASGTTVTVERRFDRGPAA